MVRVLSCYHFRGQRIGKCDEAAAVTVAGQSIVVGIDDSVNVYSAGSALQALAEIGYDGTVDTTVKGVPPHIPEIGVPITFGSAGDKSVLPSVGCSLEEKQSGSCSSSVTSSIESDTEIRLSHSFPTVDFVRSLSFNKKGNYLLCLECRDVEGGNSKCSCIRVYFHWDRKCDILPMRTRIAGVSPSANDLEKPTLTMVEIPLTSPAIAVASCTLTGHLASLSAESVINVFSFRMKEVSGRGKVQYQDFDRLCAVEVPGFAPDTLSFLGNFISCTGSGKVHVFQIHKSDKSWSPSMLTTEKYDLLKSRSTISSGRNSTMSISSPKLCAKEVKSIHTGFDYSNKVTYDPNDESVTVHLPSITRANRKRAGNSIVMEEYSNEITQNKSRIIFSSATAGATVAVEDILRLSLPQPIPGVNTATTERFLETQLFPVRLDDNLGGVTCIVGLTREALSYHLPTKEGCNPTRITNYTFTAPLVTFTFDSLFFHALTESGLESYTSRGLYYALQDYEGFEAYQNACPLKSERPCLVGIRPFVKVRFMAANESLICLLACPTSTSVAANLASSSSSLPQDERLWTVYSLELPDIDMLYEDTMRVAKSQEGQADTYFTLLCELHLILRAYLNFTPEDVAYYTPRYRELCKSIGLEYLKAAWTISGESKDIGSPSNINQNFITLYSQSQSATYEELLDLGVTYLCMAKLDIQQVFSSENAGLLREPKFVQGAAKLIDVLLTNLFTREADKHNFSPALSSSIVDFLSQHNPETLMELVIKLPFLRENQSTRLVEILQDFAATRTYEGKETVALILTLIAAGGVESNVRSQVQEILEKANRKELGNFLDLEFIMDRNSKHSALTDVAICLTAVHSDLPTTIISDAMKRHQVSVSEVMLAFAKAVNLNSESQIQRSLAKALRTVLESYFADKIISKSTGADNMNIQGCFAYRSELNPILSFTEDERHAVQALVRSYISDISLSPSSGKKMKKSSDSNFIGDNNASATGNTPVDNSQSQSESTNDNTEAEQKKNQNPSSETDNGHPVMSDVDIVATNQIFGKIPSFVNFLLNVEAPGGSVTPKSRGFSSSFFSGLESMESYIRLLSLLSSSCGKVEGVKDSVLNFVYNNSSSVKSTPLQLILLMFCEPVETAISILISRQPTTVLVYAKEMFGKSTAKWKILVTQLKKRINLNPNSSDSDMFSTIIESVYLHLANTLTLTELEEVLEKGSEDVAKFRNTCKRVELANNYASMVIEISTEYLQNQNKQ